MQGVSLSTAVHSTSKCSEQLQRARVGSDTAWGTASRPHLFRRDSEQPRCDTGTLPLAGAEQDSRAGRRVEEVFFCRLARYR